MNWDSILVKDNALAGTMEKYGGNSKYKDNGIEWLLLAKLKSMKR